MITCKNCNQKFEGHFCNNCGQSADTHKINSHFLWHDIQHGLLHFDKGIFFTLKELFTRPGYSIKEFIEGKRVKHFKPISLILLLAGIYTLLYHYFHASILEGSFGISGTGKDVVQIKSILEKVNEWATQHFAIVALLQLPIFATATFLSFRKSGYNFMEHIVLNAFLTAQRLVLHILLFPVIYINSHALSMQAISIFDTITGFGIMVWTLIQFFNREKKMAIFLKTLLTYILYLIMIGIIESIGAFIYLQIIG